MTTSRQEKMMKTMNRCQEWRKRNSAEWKWWEAHINLLPPDVYGVDVIEVYRERILYCLSHYPENDSGIEFWRDECLSWKELYGKEEN